jgi:hypothetical protein
MYGRSSLIAYKNGCPPKATSYDSPEFCHVEDEDKIPISTAIARSARPSVISRPAIVHLL